MTTLWFALVAVMLAVYAVLDGFDLGVGAIHFLAGRTDGDRELVIRSVGPVWDGNEVWLLAAGGTLYFAFPGLYASSFSGFYLPLMMVLWLLMGRGISIELRGHVTDPIWHQFFDAIFCISSALLAVFLGAALGNVIRGVPLGRDGTFFLPLWTTFRVEPNPGVLDWYTVLIGLLTLVVLVMHGASYLVLKMQGELRDRAKAIARQAWWLTGGLSVLGLIASLQIRPELLDNYRSMPAGFLIPIVVFASLMAQARFRTGDNDLAAFLSSSVFIVFMLVGVVFALYPVVLPAITKAEYALTIHNTSTSEYGLRIGLRWWSVGMLFTVAYFTYVYRQFRGRLPHAPS